MERIVPDEGEELIIELHVYRSGFAKAHWIDGLDEEEVARILSKLGESGGKAFMVM